MSKSPAELSSGGTQRGGSLGISDLRRQRQPVIEKTIDCRPGWCRSAVFSVVFHAGRLGLQTGNETGDGPVCAPGYFERRQETGTSVRAFRRR